MECVYERRKLVCDNVEGHYTISLNASSLLFCCVVKLTKHVEVRVLEVLEKGEKLSEAC